MVKPIFDQISTMEWTKQTTLNFINDYRLNPVLWHPFRKQYINVKDHRLQSVLKLSEKYNCSVQFIRNKIKCLRSSFYRQHGKLIQRSKMQQNDSNTSTTSSSSAAAVWFAYDEMKFILDSDENVNEDYSYTGFLNYDCLELKSEDSSSFSNNLQQQLLLDENKSMKGAAAAASVAASAAADDDNKNEELDIDRAATKSDNSQIKREIPENQDKVKNDLTCNDCIFKRDRERDDLNVFGEHVALTLKRLKTEKSGIMAKHLINNILFEAEMGKYDT